MDRTEILPEHFKGIWRVVASATNVPGHVTIFENAKRKYFFRWEKEKPCEVHFDPNTDNIHVPEKELCISFWRHPSVDHIFARSSDEDEPLWGARRRDEKPDKEKEKIHREICKDICGEWNVTFVTGGGTPSKDSKVEIQRAVVPSGKNHLDRAAPELFCLFEITKKSTRCYDILTFDSKTVTFNSIFRVRSINYWYREGGKKKEKMIFAMFDNRFTLPAGHFGDSPLAGLLSFEALHVKEKWATLEDPPSPTSGDPNTGCWTGDGG